MIEVRPHVPAMVWIFKVQKSPAYRDMMATKPIQARVDGKLRSGLHRVTPNNLSQSEVAQFEDFMFEHHEFKGDIAIVTAGKNFGQFAFTDKNDAMWFEFFWSL